jgi:tumor protein p53-inducible protein 3
MRAILQKNTGSAETLFIGETQNPRPKTNEILVSVKATALNRADIAQREGKYPPPKGESEILGLECSGIVLESNSEKWEVGDKLFGLVPGGAYAEQLVIHEDMAIKMPEYFTFEQSTAIPEAFLTAFQALIWLAQLEKNQSVLIHAGASGVGNAAIQLAKSLGCYVFTTCSVSKMEFCKNSGADKVIDYNSESFDQIILDMTEQNGVNAIIDFIGGNYLMKNVNSLSKDGKIVQLATLGGSASVLDLRKLMAKRGSLIASTLRSRTRDYQIKLTKEFWTYAESKFESGELKPAIDSIWDWKDCVRAHLYMEVNRNQGKIIMKID